MSADFLYKKFYKYAVFCVSLLAVALSCTYAYYLSAAKVINTSVSFHFLVSEEENVEVGAEFVKLEGGAGYLLRYQRRDYVVLSVYLREEDGASVKASLSENGEEVRLISVSIPRLYFTGYREKKKSDMYVGALRCLYSYACVLSECITALDNGQTQERTRGLLRALETQFLFVAKEYEKGYPTFSLFCQAIAARLLDLQGGVLYARELRYLLCELAEGYISFAGKFAL